MISSVINIGMHCKCYVNSPNSANPTLTIESKRQGEYTTYGGTTSIYFPTHFPPDLIIKIGELLNEGIEVDERVAVAKYGETVL